MYLYFIYRLHITQNDKEENSCQAVALRKV